MIDEDMLADTIKRVNAKVIEVDITDEALKKTRTNRELSNANLIPVKPGEIRNPKGRPKDIKYISEALKDLLAKDPVLLKQVVEAMLREVKQGNIPALKELLDRTEGKVADKIEGTENPVTIVLRPARDRE